jgi:hypothetical protein
MAGARACFSSAEEEQPGRDAVGLGGLYWNELVLGVAGRDDDQPANRAVPGVTHGVGRPPRYEDDAAGCDPELTVPELERGVSIGDVERLVGVRVKVKGRPGLAWRERPNQDDVGPLGLGRAEASGLLGGRDDGAAVGSR